MRTTSSNPSMAGYFAEIRRMRPDAVILEEARPGDVARLEAGGVLDSLPHRNEVNGVDPFIYLLGSAVSGTRYPRDREQPSIVQTSIMLPSGPQTLWIVHTTAPLPSSFEKWRSQVAFIDDKKRPGALPDFWSSVTSTPRGEIRASGPSWRQG